jgi:hypothetical protein
MSFGNLYNPDNIILFIFEKSLVVRVLTRLRNDGLHILDVKSCRVAIDSGYYISFHFKTLKQIAKFFELNYLFEKNFGFILLKQTFLNCSLSQFKHLLASFSFMYILKLL